MRLRAAPTRLLGSFWLAAALASVTAGSCYAAAADKAEQFEIKIRPILANRCFACHSSTALGGLTMSNREGLLRGGKSGPALIPGKPEESLMIQAIEHTNEKMKMPMGQGKLPESEIALLTEWVKAGAYWPEQKTTPIDPKNAYVITPEQRAFWAFQPIKKSAVPEVKNQSWAAGAVDRFILEQLEAKSLQPNPRANKRDLIRRAYLDLTGIPPTYEETEAFMKDTSPDAYAKVVDELLASPRYGERWSRYWLDVSRYADDRLDSDVELPYPNSFRYRDWVIKAFNDDMPYDLFVKAKIAGDQIDKNDNQLDIGLGFYGLSPELTDDRVDVTTRGFLAMTAACAQWLHYKFDPI